MRISDCSSTCALPILNAPRHAIEEPRMIRGEHHHQRRAAIVVGNRCDVERSVTRLPDMDQIGGDHLDRLGDPIAFGKAFRDLYAGFAFAAELPRQRILLPRASTLSSAPLFSPSQPLFA